MNCSRKESFNLKVMINKEESKVLFALAESDFADVLFSFLTLPLGKILEILKKHYGDRGFVLGCLNNLYEGLVNLDTRYFSTEARKQMLLNPTSPYCTNLNVNIGDSGPIKSYSDSGNKDCPALPIGDGLIFTKKEVSYFIGEDLRIFPSSTGSLLECLNTLGIKETEGAEIRTFAFGSNEIMGLLMGSLFSRTPLTDIILNQREKYYPFVPSLPNNKKKSSSRVIDAFRGYFKDNKMVVKVMVQKSENKFLFAQVEESFVNFLFNFLTLPLGQAEYLLGSATPFRSIDNLYNSIAKFEANHHLKSSNAKNMLTISQFINVMNFLRGDSHSYMKGKGMFMVTDDLTVTPLCLISRLSALKDKKIPISDVKELEVHVGLKEAINILRASLTSSSALTEGLKLNLKRPLKTRIMGFMKENVPLPGMKSWRRGCIQEGLEGYQELQCD